MGLLGIVAGIASSDTPFWIATTVLLIAAVERGLAAAERWRGW